ncbi:MAG: ATP-dependent DNA helicase RecG [Firmicutes bacterium]|nr:ATP-dependent DNA helicase RecG [Bacillota bacterium]
MNLSDPVTAIKGIGPKKAESLQKLGLFTVEDVTARFPRSYEDRRNPKAIASLKDGDRALVRAKVVLITKGRGFGRNRTLRILAEDSTGRMEALYFHAAYLEKAFRQGSEYAFFGKVKNENGRITMFQPDFAIAENEEEGILPVYSLSKGISQKEMRRIVKDALSAAEPSETLPLSVIKREGLCSRSYALNNIHFPQDETKYKEARYRLIFEEFFYLRSALMLSKNRFGAGREGRSVRSGWADRFIDRLPYPLTEAQRRSVEEILGDMADKKAMNRLLQGDVGSGKTAVAMAALAEACGAGFQGAFMAPTEILAKQHYATLTRELGPLGITVDLLLGSQTAAERKAVLTRLASGQTQVVAGTHAVISEKVAFQNLGLVITDEQHRFGVNQRKKLSEKGENPDVLVMTATPIPRTLAVVLYADLDVSVLDQLPPGRRPIQTRQYTEQSRKEAYRLLLQQVEEGRQAYIVAPFIEDSESVDGRSAEGLYEEFRKEYPQVSCALLHGAMKQNEKDAVMEKFAAGQVSVLISTVVIEVGIDVPNATVMIVENAERFGLAQLHQLRGRVGRGAHQSFCLLVLGESTDVAKERAATMCETTDGFVIAEKDLSMRGPGEFFGFRQHGLPQLALADPVRHMDLARKAGDSAMALLAADPGLQSAENSDFYARLKDKYVDPQVLIL